MCLSFHLPSVCVPQYLRSQLVDFYELQYSKMVDVQSSDMDAKFAPVTVGP
jgi:hypothetical protein